MEDEISALRANMSTLRDATLLMAKLYSQINSTTSNINESTMPEQQKLTSTPPDLQPNDTTSLDQDDIARIDNTNNSKPGLEAANNPPASGFINSLRK